MESISLLNQINYKTIFQQWKINLKTNIVSIIIIIKKDYNIYKSSFNLIYITNFKLLSSNNSLRQMIDSLLNYINNNQIMIKENKTNLKINFSSKRYFKYWINNKK